MRTAFVSLVLAAIMSCLPFSHALAASSDEAKLAKIVRKYAFAGNNVFDDSFKPKAICHCNDAGKTQKVGFLYTSSGLNLLCALPTTFTNGEFVVVDFGCQNFNIIGK